VIINEAAMIANLQDTWDMVIRPMLADLRGSADFYSTPKGLNDFHRLWGQAGDNPDWVRFHKTTYDNPFIARLEIDSMKASLPERVFQQEILAAFLEDGAYFQNVSAACSISKPDQPGNHRGHYLVAGVDWAISEDYTAITIACRDCNQVVDWDRFNRIDYTYQRERLLAITDRWQASILAERNSIGVPNLELLHGRAHILTGSDGIPGFLTTATTKPQLIQDLATALYHHGLRVPVEYADELSAYQVELSSTGHQKFEAPSGMHDDRVISLALAWRGISRADRYGGIHL
jgi:hypothetical protein